MMRLLPIVLLAALWQGVAVSGLVNTDFLPPLSASMTRWPTWCAGMRS